MSEGRRVLSLPGWQNSGPGHWQSRWEALYGDERVEQADWHWPRRGDWMARLDEVLQADTRPAVLVAHSLGCHLVAAWAAHTRHRHRVVGALLVAPPDIEREDMPPQVSTWRRAVLESLPFPATLIHSEDDPYCSAARAQQFATAWHAQAHGIGRAGHINADSGLGDWPAGRQHLQGWLA